MKILIFGYPIKNSFITYTHTIIMNQNVIYDSETYKETEPIIARINAIHESSGDDVHIKFTGWNFGNVDLLQKTFPDLKVYHEHVTGFVPPFFILHVSSSC